MYKIYIFADSYKHFEEAINEYEKRLWKYIFLNKLKPSKKSEEPLIIKDETENIIKKLEKENWYKIVLKPTWKNYKTQEFYNFINKKKQTNSSFIFIIWWALWLDYKLLKPYVDLELWLWDFTMPHSLALVILLEQIYRIEMIKKWTNYHK